MRTHFNKQTYVLLPVSFLLLVLLVTTTANAFWPLDRKANIAAQFLDKANLPFSFTYGGRSSRELMADWDLSHSIQEQENKKLHTITYTDTVTGLELISEVIEYIDFPAVEWVLYFKNTGDKNTPILKDVHAADVRFDINSVHGEAILHRALGNITTKMDFAPMQEFITMGLNKKIAPLEGRSANGNMPFFNLEINGNHGAIMAIGWTGQWAANFYRQYGPDGKFVSVKAGMENTHLTLYPGERIRTPRILFFLWQSDNRIDGHNQYRRFIVKYHTPHADGKPVDLIIAPTNWCTSMQEGKGYTEQGQLELIDNCKNNGLSFNCCWIDAGWFECGNPPYWPKVGTWRVDRRRFPNGLKPISEKAHANGMKFLLWFEPERVTKGTQIHLEHPEWTIPSPSPGGEVATLPSEHLFDMGNPEARKWITDHVAKMILDNNIDIYRHDANIDPLHFWQNGEDPQRVGIREIRHIEGLYEYWEELKRCKPGLIVECCCSGNRRFDLETITRTVNLWRSDYIQEANCSQAQTYGLSQYVILHGTGMLNLPGRWGNMTPSTPENKDTVEKYDFRSALSTSIVVEWLVHKPDFNFELAKHHIDLFNKTRELFYGDYYPLTPYSIKQTVWLAYQFHRDDLKKGVIFAFRRLQCQTNELTVKPGGLFPDKQYEVENIDTGEKRIINGAELAAGLRIQSQTMPEAVVLLYKQI